ncbi:hypothetical protein [Belnapia rosea]|uniref:hypothetical protein n=1 Tax=Belnapia rosea TaxID=938405 RepID=UPI00115F91AC|nr:hypothetical protein [Belnapia rosea]
MQTNEDQATNPEIATLLLRIFEEAFDQHEMRQRRGKSAATQGDWFAAAEPVAWQVGLASLEALAKFSGYKDLASACARLVSLEEHKR